MDKIFKNAIHKFLSRLSAALIIFIKISFNYRMQTKIEIKTIIFFAVCGILAVATTLTNATILMVFSTKKKLINGQEVYRISLAMSDFLAGIIVFPTFIYSYFTYGCGKYDQIYVNVVGFFTMLNLHVSISTLVAAAIDRFKAVYRPLTYNAKTHIKIARKTCLGLWLISILAAMAPTGIFNKNFTFVVVNATYVLPSLSNDFKAFYIYAVTLIILPVAIMWVFTILTFCVYKKSLKKRKKIFITERQKLKSEKEIQFVLTVGIMVGVFSICLFPAAMLLITAISSGIIYWSTATTSVVILTSNSLWNFFIYSAREKEFRSESKKLYKKLLFVLK